MVVYVIEQRGIQKRCLYMNLRWYRDRLALYVRKYMKGVIFISVEKTPTSSGGE